ncbi:MAG: acyl-ACP--UDP-N-acetylglucosamine O-acyltransferase [Phycisphaerae bacterium]|nr:acyl-ACP--UDP-N-acetylglucosamine O-acyltransferase [Phycisphaerae bacterium]
MPIHPTAIVDKTAEIDPTAEIGAYAVVEKNVRIGAQTRLYPHAYVSEGTTLGARCQIHPFAVVGHPPQDLKFAGQPSYTRIGDETVVREHATIHRGTMPGSTTIVGRRCFIMATAHIGHNCVLGNDVVLVNSVLLSGHVEIGDRALISGNASVHQFVRIGELAMLSGLTPVPKDVPPFMLMVRSEYIAGPNVVGLRRAGFSSAERHELRRCHRVLYRSGLHFPQAIERVAEMVDTDPGRRLVEFLRSSSKRGYMTGRRPGQTLAADGEQP